MDNYDASLALAKVNGILLNEFDLYGPLKYKLGSLQ